MPESSFTEEGTTYQVGWESQTSGLGAPGRVVVEGSFDEFSQGKEIGDGEAVVFTVSSVAGEAEASTGSSVLIDAGRDVGIGEADFVSMVGEGPDD